MPSTFFVGARTVHLQMSLMSPVGPMGPPQGLGQPLGPMAQNEAMEPMGPSGPKAEVVVRHPFERLLMIYMKSESAALRRVSRLFIFKLS